MRQSEYEPFKHVIQDVSKVYVGAQFSYKELLEREEVPFKLKSVVTQYMIKDVSPDLTITDHIFQMKDTDISYFAYKQMKAKFKINVPTVKGRYESKMFSADEILQNEELEQNKDKIVIEEVIIKKLALAAM